MKILRSVSASVLSVCLGAAALAQGDDCSAATAIAGLGSWSFDTTNLSTSGFDGGGSCVSPASAIQHDGFYQWIVPAQGDYQFDTIGSTFDTQLSVHAGNGCSATCVGYDDDTGSLQSVVVLSGLHAGDPYLIQVGGFATSVGLGTLRISSYVDPCTSDDLFEDNDTCATAAVIAPGTYTNLVTTIADPDFYEIAIPPDSIMTWTEIYDWSLDTYMNFYQAGCSSQFGTSNSYFAYTTGATSETLVVEVFQSSGSSDPCAPYEFRVDITAAPCSTAPDDTFEDNDNCAAAAAVVDGTYPGLFVSKFDKDHYSFCVPAGATVDIQVLFPHALGDLDAFLWDASDTNCGSGFGSSSILTFGYSASDNEILQWTNSTGSDVDCVLEVNVYASSLNDCNHYDLVLSGAGGCSPGGVISPYCGPADLNSTGGPAALSGSFGTGIGSDLHIEATGGPTGELGYLLIGSTAMNPGFALPGGGRLCLDPAGPISRYNLGGGPLNSTGQFDAAGVLQNQSGTSGIGSGFDVPSTLPFGGNSAILSGDTWCFQLWFRDAAAGGNACNLSNGLAVTFP
ncbi:MAG: hypothetical protein R3F33_13150 [Planctomycetota bacterium]